MNRSAWMVALAVAGCTTAQTEPMEPGETAATAESVEVVEPVEIAEVEPVAPAVPAEPVETIEVKEPAELLEPLELDALAEVVELVEPVQTEVEGMKPARRAGDLLFGGQPTEAALEALAEEGYLSVLTTRGEGELKWDEQALVEDLGLEFHWIPMGKPLDEITDQMVADFGVFMATTSRPALLHCGSGNRVSGLWAVWLVEKQDVDAQVAIDLAKKAGMTRMLPLVEKRLGVKAGK